MKSKVIETLVVVQTILILGLFFWVWNLHNDSSPDPSVAAQSIDDSELLERIEAIEYRQGEQALLESIRQLD